jgi:hypothetical protein
MPMTEAGEGPRRDLNHILYSGTHKAEKDNANTAGHDMKFAVN